MHDLQDAQLAALVAAVAVAAVAAAAVAAAAVDAAVAAAAVDAAVAAAAAPPALAAAGASWPSACPSWPFWQRFWRPAALLHRAAVGWPTELLLQSDSARHKTNYDVFTN